MKLTAETFIRTDRDTVWRLTQTPTLHARWDLRFTEIGYLPRPDPGAPQRFRYATRIGFGLTIEGWGETVGERDGQGSALRFGSDDPRSLIREGSGFWAYRPEPGGLRFWTVYDYRVRHGLLGRIADRLFFRPLMIWATRWSFDRLRLWIEREIAPEALGRLWLLKVAARTALGLVWATEGLVPKLLFVRPDEVALVRQSGLFWPSPEATLSGLGIAEVLAGIWLLSGHGERWAAALTSAAMLVLATLVATTEPRMLADPLGGLSKNWGLLACALAVLLLSPITPSARRAHPSAAGRPAEKTPSERETRMIENAALSHPSRTTPFEAALGDALQHAAPGVRARLCQRHGVQRFQGRMRRVWRASGWRRWASCPILALSASLKKLFPETGAEVPFELENAIGVLPDGRATMSWRRTFRFPHRTRQFDAHMVYDADRGVIMDSLGTAGHLEVELFATIEEGALCIRSGRQRLKLGPCRIPLPACLVGHASVRDWEEADGRFGVRVTISNPILGAFFGYEGWFAPIGEAPAGIAGG